jgi:hypothetical protein
MMTLTRPGLLLAALLLGACVAYEPVDPYTASWNAAIAAAGDAGVTILSTDRVTGVITGSKPPFTVRIAVKMRADARVQVEIKARGPQGEDPTLARRISEAYERRMGR